LKNDVSSPRNYLKKIPVVIRGNPPISKEIIRMLNNEFGEIRYDNSIA
jgi:uncharacterized protein YneF (UPF0154 family)